MREDIPHLHDKVREVIYFRNTMALKKTSLIVPKECEGLRIDQALAQLLPKASGLELSKGKIRKLIIAGAVYLNSGRIRIASKSVRAGAKVDVFIDSQKLDIEKPRNFQMTAADIFFEDEWILGVRKDAGMPTQPTLDEARANLYAILKKFLKERDGKEPYVGLHHRLDRDTSGVMLFTKAKEANAEVGRLFQEHLAQKTYLAIVSTSGKPLPGEWVVDNFLARDKGKAGKMRSVSSGGDRALTSFRTLAEGKGSSAVTGFALIEAKPRTGRMHQIRVHLSEGGNPILGDLTYGGSANYTGLDRIPRVMLHAASLTFPHPITKLEITFNAPLPTDFEKCLKQLRLQVPSFLE